LLSRTDLPVPLTSILLLFANIVIDVPPSLVRTARFRHRFVRPASPLSSAAL
jgi:hypothetical protein